MGTATVDSSLFSKRLWRAAPNLALLPKPLWLTVVVPGDALRLDWPGGRVSFPS